MKILNWMRGALSWQNDKVSVSQIIDLLNKGTPLLSMGRELYNIPEVRMTINFIAEKFASVPFYHVRSDLDGNSELINSSVQRVLTVRANPWQSPQVFWTYAITRLLLANNVFIFPNWDSRGQLLSWHVLPFTQFDFDQDEEGRSVIHFHHDKRYSLYYDDVIHLQRFPTAKGGAARQATGGYVEIVGTLQSQAVEDSKNSQRVAALLQAKTSLRGSDMKKKLDEFKELFLTAENTTGFGMIGAEYDVHQLNMKLTPLNKEVMEAVVEYLYNYFGASKQVVTHRATELEYEQFIDNSIKPLIFQAEEETTYKIFSQSEIGHNNKIAAELIDLEISTLSAKTNFFKEMIFGGVLSRNEIRRRLYVPRGPKELDKFQESKNFQTLQPGNYKVKGGEDTEQEDEQ